MRSHGKKGTITSHDDDAVVRVGDVGARDARIDKLPAARAENDLSESGLAVPDSRSPQS